MESTSKRYEPLIQWLDNVESVWVGNVLHTVERFDMAPTIDIAEELELALGAAAQKFGLEPDQLRTPNGRSNIRNARAYAAMFLLKVRHNDKRAFYPVTISGALNYATVDAMTRSIAMFTESTNR